MSYNVEMYDSDDGWEGRDPYKALDTVLDVSPDIVGLQEIDKHWDGSYELSWLEQLQGKTTTNYLTRLTSNGYTRISGSGSKSHPELFYKGEPYQNYLNRNLSPKIELKFEEALVNEKRVVVLTVGAANDVPTAFNGVRYISK